MQHLAFKKTNEENQTQSSSLLTFVHMGNFTHANLPDKAHKILWGNP